MLILNVLFSFNACRAAASLSVKSQCYQGHEANLPLGGLWSLGANNCLIQFEKATGVRPHSLLMNNEGPMLPDRETRQACLSLSLLTVILLSTFTKGCCAHSVNAVCVLLVSLAGLLLAFYRDLCF